MNHSPEPWRCHPERQGDYGHAIYSDDGVCVADVVEHYHSINDEANAKRIVACVNALTGIQDPHAFMQSVRSLVSAVKLSRLIPTADLQKLCDNVLE